jgi:hypothetical protein
MNTKKLIVFLMVASLCAATAFAQETGSAPFRISVGGGGLISGNFSTWSVDDSVPGSLSRYNSTHLNTAPFLFLDLKYLELNFGLLLGQMNAGSAMSDDPNFPARTLGLRGGAFLKLPFAISPTFTLFPLLGVDYDFYLLAKKDDGRDARFPISAGNQSAKPSEALNTLWFKAGIGWDAFFTDNLFLRTEVLYGLRLHNKMEQHLQATRQDADILICHGGDFKIAIGYQF